MIERAVVVMGTVGVGKTTVAEQVAGLLEAAGEPHAYIDLDALSALWPRPSDDRFNRRVTATNLGCVAKTMAEAGARTLVLAGVVEGDDVLGLYERAVGITITVVRLKCPLAVVEARLRHRYGNTDPQSLTWHLERAPELDAILDASSLQMRTVSSTASPIEVAQAVVAAWRSTTASLPIGSLGVRVDRGSGSTRGVVGRSDRDRDSGPF